MISNTEPQEDSGMGITDYPYQLATHLKPFLSKKDITNAAFMTSSSG